MNLGLAAIGGKDSMSGTYQDINVPPTLISFACADGKKLNTISPELKRLETSFIISITKLKKMDCQITKI
jgi:phosphoribosylformylglycinamidine (FGAM) synthase-like enzyme